MTIFYFNLVVWWGGCYISSTRRSTEDIDSMEMKLHAVMSCLLWLLGNKFGCPLRSGSILNCLYSSKQLSFNTKNVFAHWIPWIFLLKACWHALMGLFLSSALPFLHMPVPHCFDYCTFIDNIIYSMHCFLL